jgi:alpha-beta hydrolase superfamily lysophospholipase
VYWTEKQGELIFRPTKETFWGYNGASLGASLEERWIPVGGEGQKLNAWWLKSNDPHAPAILYLHGARWNLTGSALRLERWRRLGFAVLAIDYRGFGKSTDVVPTEELANEDAEAAWEYLGRLAPGRARYVVGHSLGGAVATELVVRHPEAAGLVLEATFTSVRDLIATSSWGWLPVDLLITENFDTLKRIPKVKVPVIVAHGTRDNVVPFEMGERLYEAATAPKQMVKVEGASHHNLSSVGFEQYRAAISQMLRAPRS